MVKVTVIKNIEIEHFRKYFQDGILPLLDWNETFSDRYIGKGMNSLILESTVQRPRSLLSILKGL